MARGRMISNSLSTSEKFAGLSPLAMGEFCQALYPLLVSHSDDFGRLQGDPFTVRAKCFPASPRSLEDFQAALQHLDGVGLIVWYTVSAKRFVQICDFDRHQQGLHKRTKSLFPGVPGIPATVPDLPTEEKGRELKGTEGKRTEEERVDAGLTAPTSEGRTFLLGSRQITEWQVTYSQIDVWAELRKAAVWLEANPSRRKAQRTMLRYFNNWLLRAAKDIVDQKPGNPRTLAPASAFVWNCDHDPRCPNRAACAIVAARPA